ncbi:MAG: T6SS phospholipase effector Tle1-like catalytic domain-containing protein, partial [Rhodopila sp.]
MPYRRLVVCCDGTWNAADGGASATNVVRMLRCIARQAEDGTPQIVRYHPGVGTGNPLDHMLGGGLGIGLAPAIRDVYAFLANNYILANEKNQGDEIFLFGFSRGAFTARSIAGLIGAIGLLHPTEMGRFMDAWRWAQLPANQRDINDLNKCFPRRTRDVPIRCIGVWDTVGALGVPRNRLLKGWHPCAETFRFHDTSRGSHVEHAFQALAIDERREPFEPVLWTAPRNPLEKQVICQVWFAGVHADIGGGYADHGPAAIPFLWMLGQVAPLLALDEDAIRYELDTSEEY